MSKCLDCGKSCKGTRCRNCYKVNKGYSIVGMGDRTLSDLEYIGSKQQGSNNYSRVRDHALKVAKEVFSIYTRCSRCGYDKHVQICHIKSISSFPKTATLNEINSPSNLIILCPNCHWELDHGVIWKT